MTLSELLHPESHYLHANYNHHAEVFEKLEHGVRESFAVLASPIGDCVHCLKEYLE